MSFRLGCLLGLHRWSDCQGVEGNPCAKAVVCLACRKIKSKEIEHQELTWEYIDDTCNQNGRCARCRIIVKSVLKHDYEWAYFDNSCKLQQRCRRCKSLPALPDPFPWYAEPRYAKVEHRKVVRCDNKDSCVREKCEHCGEVLSYDHNWVLDEVGENDYTINPVSHSHVDSDTTTCYYHCSRCSATHSKSVTSQWVVH